MSGAHGLGLLLCRPLPLQLARHELPHVGQHGAAFCVELPRGWGGKADSPQAVSPGGDDWGASIEPDHVLLDNRQVLEPAACRARAETGHHWTGEAASRTCCHPWGNSQEDIRVLRFKYDIISTAIVCSL